MLTLQEKCMSLQVENETLRASLKRKQDELDECRHKKVQTKSSRKKKKKKLEILTTSSEDDTNTNQMAEEEGEEFDKNALNMELDCTHVSDITLCPNCSKKFASRQSLRRHCTTYCQKKMSKGDFNKTFPPYNRM
jgi:hypothetical protein